MRRSLNRSSHLPAMVALLLLLITASAIAQPIGGYAGSFLRRPVLAQEIAMGGAFSSFSPDASAIFGNAASLAFVERPSASVSGSTFSFGVLRSAVFGFGTTLGGYGGIGFGIMTLGTGEHPAYGNDFRRQGTVANPHFAFSVGAGLPIGTGSIGATVRYIRQDYTGSSGGDVGYSVDISGTLLFEDRFHLGLSLNDIAGEMAIGGESGLRERIPWNARLNGTYVHPLEERTETVRPDPTGTIVVRQLKPETYVLGAVEMRVSEIDSLPLISVAAETVPVAGLDFGFRLGWSSSGDLGAGFLYRLPVEFTRELRIDYAVRREYSLGDITHHVTLTAGL